MIIHGFETSNNMKVRVALGYKGIPYTFKTIEPSDRSELAEISGQHLTPVMQHGETVLFDSAAILRYLESNFPDTPRLFGSSVAEQWEIEDWELFARTRIAGPLMKVVHTKVTGGTVDDALITAANAAFDRAAEELAAGLDDRDWLVGEAMSVADVTAAATIFRIRGAGFFEMPEAVARLAPWVERVMAYDAKQP